VEINRLPTTDAKSSVETKLEHLGSFFIFTAPKVVEMSDDDVSLSVLSCRIQEGTPGSKHRHHAASYATEDIFQD